MTDVANYADLDIDLELDPAIDPVTVNVCVVCNPAHRLFTPHCPRAADRQALEGTAAYRQRVDEVVALLDLIESAIRPLPKGHR